MRHPNPAHHRAEEARRSFLATDRQSDILAGRQPADLNLEKLMQLAIRQERVAVLSRMILRS